MDVVGISLGGEAAPSGEQQTADEAPAEAFTVNTTIKIAGVEREARTTTRFGKKVVHTTRLSVMEQKMLSRAQDARDEQKAAAMWNYAAATVRMIDGDAIGFPTTDAQINAIIARLGDDMAEYILRYLTGSVQSVADEAKN